MTVKNQKMRPTIHLFFLLSILMLLASCGQKRVVLVPPGFSLAEMSALPENSAIDIQLRLENRSEIGMEITALDLSLDIDGQTVTTRITKQPRTVASLSREIVVLAADYDSGVIESLDRLNSGGASRLQLVISGSLQTASGRTLELDEQLWISATPGKPGYFR